MKCCQISVLLALVAVLIPSGASAATLSVTNNGVDSATCGAPSSPCRSITQAIANATAGDTILVGPGRYGDLTDGESSLTFPGEEMPPVGSEYLIVLDKQLTIESTHGAAATEIYGGGSDDLIGVGITADGAVFGRPGKGFLFIQLRTAVSTGPGTTGITVAGNEGTSGFLVDGMSNTFSHNRDVGGATDIKGIGHTISNNTFSGTGSAMSVEGSDHALTGNLILGLTIDLSYAVNINVRGNSFLAALYRAGIEVGPEGSATINENNFLSNAPPWNPPEGNCGIFNSSQSTIDATNNFWGAASGPGPDPADQACDEGESVTVVTPFATQAFAITPPGVGNGGGNGSPVCSAAQAVASVLWPANGQFIRVWIIGVGDPDSDPVSISVSGVTQDEPTSGLVTNDIGPDAAPFGSSVDLRAQRDSAGNGRVYRVSFVANDGNGGTCSGAVTVGVPNSQKPGQPIVDDGQVFTSTNP